MGVGTGGRVARFAGTSSSRAHTEPLGDGRERHFIAAWLSPDDKHQIGQPVSPSEFAELTAEQFHASIREESYVVRLLDGLDDDARRRAVRGNASNRSVLLIRYCKLGVE